MSAGAVFRPQLIVSTSECFFVGFSQDEDVQQRLAWHMDNMRTGRSSSLMAAALADGVTEWRLLPVLFTPPAPGRSRLECQLQLRVCVFFLIVR